MKNEDYNEKEADDFKIKNMVSEINADIRNLSATINRLEEKIEPILIPEKPVKEASGKSIEEVQNDSFVMTEIKYIKRRIRTVELKVESLIKRIDL